MSDNVVPLRGSGLRRWIVRSAVLVGLGLSFWLVSATTASADDDLPLSVSSALSTATHAPAVVAPVTDVAVQSTDAVVDEVAESVVAPVRSHVTAPLVEHVVEPAVTPVVDPLDPVAVPVVAPLDAAPVQPTAVLPSTIRTVAADEPGPAVATTPSTATVPVAAPATVQSVAAPVPAPMTSAPAPLPSSAPPASPGNASGGSAGADGGAAVPAGRTATHALAALGAPAETGRADAVDAVSDPSFSPD